MRRIRIVGLFGFLAAIFLGACGDEASQPEVAIFALEGIENSIPRKGRSGFFRMKSASIRWS